MSHRRGSLILLGVFGLSILVSCSTTAQDFKSEGEKFLESPDLSQEAGYMFSNAICQQPTTVSPGTQYSCTATDNDGDDWEFLIEITGERSLTVISGEVLG